MCRIIKMDCRTTNIRYLKYTPIRYLEYANQEILHVYFKSAFFSFSRWSFGLLQKLNCSHCNQNLSSIILLIDIQKANCTLPLLSKVNIFLVVYFVTLRLLNRCTGEVYKNKITRNKLHLIQAYGAVITETLKN